jgi:hypothetical protein
MRIVRVMIVVFILFGGFLTMAGFWALIDTDKKSNDENALYWANGTFLFAICFVVSSDIVDPSPICSRCKSSKHAGDGAANKQQGKSQAPDVTRVLSESGTHVDEVDVDVEVDVDLGDVKPIHVVERERLMKAEDAPVGNGTGPRPDEVRKWLRSHTQIAPETADIYSQLLIDAGYDTLASLRALETDQDLVNVGIEQEDDREILLAAVQNLRADGWHDVPLR